MINLLEFEPIKKFIDTLGKDIEKYFGKDDASILCLRPDGIFYGKALYDWLKHRKKNNAVLISMEDDGADLKEKSVYGRKALIVNNDVVTGKSYKRSMEALRARKKEWNIKDIKYAVFFDRIGLADFSVDKYSAEAVWRLDDIDALDLKIIKHLSQDGRASFADIGKKINLSSVSVKNRADKLISEKILKVQGALSISKFYTVSAHIQIEASEKTVGELIETLEKKPEVYHLATKVSGKCNLLIGMVGRTLEDIQDFIEKEIRMVPGVRQLDIYIGDPPLIPKTFLPKL